MGRYVLKRVVWLAIIMVCVAILIFTVMFFVPGDPVEIMLGDTATPEAVQEYRDKLGLNDPYIVQLGRYLYDTFIRWDFGTSYSLKAPVMSEFLNRLPRTMGLGYSCLLLTVIIGIPLGVHAAMHRGGFVDKAVLILTTVFISIPGFWFALLLVMLFTVQLGWLPPFGIDSWKCWIMPIIAGSVGGLAQITRQTRSAVLETMRADFVTTARAKGLASRSVIYKHMLPNAMIPIINIVGQQFAGAISGTVIIEQVYSFPGIGTYLTNAINNRDYPVIRACVLVLAMFAAVIMLLVDVLYAQIDPRIKAQYVNQAARKGGVKA